MMKYFLFVFAVYNVFIGFTENVLYCDMYHYLDMRFWSN